MRTLKNRLCYALDQVESFSEVMERVESLSPYIGVFKIGLESYITYGNELVREIKAGGHKIFLDLKLHDIPTTVEKAVGKALEFEVDFLNLHALGGFEMMKRSAMLAKGSNTRIIAVTLLTSHGEKEIEQELMLNVTSKEGVKRLATLAKEAGMSGIVCSPLEVSEIKRSFGKDFFCITPGVRLTSGNSHDQTRVCSPKEATLNGSDLLVIGRAITERSSNEERVQVAKSILGSVNEVSL